MKDCFSENEIVTLVSDLNRISLPDSALSMASPPSVSSVKEIIDRLGFLMFPFSSESKEEIYIRQLTVAEELYYWIKKCLDKMNLPTDSDLLSANIMQDITSVKASLIKDASAIFEGDPAAKSIEEIIICYPGFLATMIYRIAHIFYLKDIPYIPRMMTEIAHERTGIDIHPGARIGDSLCIDHGTGIVIGETAEIGDRVKIYQGVTIGAKSFPFDGNGRIIRDKKRHPTIGNGCIIYAGATILGGDTVIGDGCVIGGNVWLTHSLAAGSTVYYKEK